MGLELTYPVNKAEWYAKGTVVLNNGDRTYFEVPAVFNLDETCDEPATFEKVEAFIVYLNTRP